MRKWPATRWLLGCIAWGMVAPVLGQASFTSVSTVGMGLTSGQTVAQTPISETITYPNPGTELFNGEYAVSAQAFSSGGIAATGRFDYTGNITNQLIPAYDPRFGQTNLQWSSYDSYSNGSGTLDMLTVDSSLSGIVNGVSTNSHYASVASSFSGNSVDLTGAYTSTTTGGLTFGTITGTTTIGYATDHSSAAVSATTALTYTATTHIDETGLTTPRIAVTDGIAMNGSRVTGLGAGIDPADAVNKAQLDAEAATRAAADTQLAQAIGTEAGTRAAADTQLAHAIGTEADTRAAVDTQLAQGLASETSARIAADANLSSRLDGLSSRVDALNGRIDKVQRRADAGTAVAVAMGGAVFLPDMHFNLTTNVATYGGAHAGAVQVGAVVSRHVAFNAGVATGFNRGGQTAGRAGFTVGW